MEKKSNIESEKTIDIDPISFELSQSAPFYILEILDNEKYSVFNTIESAVKHIDKIDNVDIENMKLLEFEKEKDQFSISQISWSKIYQISRKIKNKKG